MRTSDESPRAGHRMAWIALIFVVFPLGLTATLRHVDLPSEPTLSASVLSLPTLPARPPLDMVAHEGVTILDGPPVHGAADDGARSLGGWLVRGLGTPGAETGFDRVGNRPGTRGFLERLQR